MDRQSLNCNFSNHFFGKSGSTWEALAVDISKALLVKAINKVYTSPASHRDRQK
jgi:hypothetical protein